MCVNYLSMILEPMSNRLKGTNLALIKELVLNAIELVFTDRQLMLQLAVIGIQRTDAILEFTTQAMTFLQLDFTVRQTLHQLLCIRHFLTNL